MCICGETGKAICDDCQERFCWAHYWPHRSECKPVVGVSEDVGEDTGAMDSEASAEEAMFGIEMTI